MAADFPQSRAAPSLPVSLTLTPDDTEPQNSCSTESTSPVHPHRNLFLASNFPKTKLINLEKNPVMHKKRLKNVMFFFSFCLHGTALLRDVRSSVMQLSNVVQPAGGGHGICSLLPRGT